MSGFGYALKIWSLTQCNISDHNININCYHDKAKKDVNSLGTLELQELSRQYHEKRNEVWMPRNKRPNKLRENIKYLEETLQMFAVVNLLWKTSNSLQIVFSSGLICSIEITTSYDVNKIVFDKSLVGKINNALCAVSSSDMTCFCFHSSSQIDFVIRKPELQLTSLPVPGPKSKVTKYMCINNNSEFIACWWRLGTWTQTANEVDKVNLLLMNCTASELTLVSAILTEYDITNLQFSKNTPNCILSIEKTFDLGEQYVCFVTYECTSGSLHRLNVSSFILKSGILTSSWDPSEQKAVICCNDGSISVYDLPSNQCTVTLTTNILIPTLSVWQGSVIIVGSANGEMVLYDSILNPLHWYDMEENESELLKLSEFVSSDGGLTKLIPNGRNEFIVFYSDGPIGILKLHCTFSFESLIDMYLRNNMPSEGVKLLRSVNWNVDGKVTCRSMLKIVDHLLSQPLNHENERLLENALSCFYSPLYPLSEVEVLNYRTTVGNYLRRFFHHLLQYCRLEQAFLVAKDLNAAELFYDIHFLAKELGDIKIAKLAKDTGDHIAGSDLTENVCVIKEAAVTSYKTDSNTLLKVKGFSGNDPISKGSSTLKVTNLGYV